MAQRWYYTTDGQTRLGPVSASELRDLVRGGQLRPADQVQPEGSARWASAGQLPGLFPDPPEAVEVSPVEEAPPEVAPVAEAAPVLRPPPDRGPVTPALVPRDA